jgi:2-dehydropantoate 2-reductase
MTLRYMIIGAGGTGAPLGAFLAKLGADVTLIARGAHLKAMQEKGLTFEQSDGETWTVPVKAFDMDGFLAAKAQGTPSPDVIFVCVKGYSLDDTIPFIRDAAGENTVVIPILNIYGTGRVMQEQLPGLLVTDGCIYISSNLKGPGVIQRHGSIFRVIYGTPDHRTDNPVLRQVESDLTAAGIDALYSPFIEKDALLKFSHVSPMATCGQYYHVKAGAMQKPGEVRECFIRLVNEILELARHRAGRQAGRAAHAVAPENSGRPRGVRLHLDAARHRSRKGLRGGRPHLSGCAPVRSVRPPLPRVPQNRESRCRRACREVNNKKAFRLLQKMQSNRRLFSV